MSLRMEQLHHQPVKSSSSKMPNFCIYTYTIYKPANSDVLNSPHSVVKDLKMLARPSVCLLSHLDFDGSTLSASSLQPIWCGSVANQSDYSHKTSHRYQCSFISSQVFQIFKCCHFILMTNHVRTIERKERVSSTDGCLITSCCISSEEVQIIAIE